MRGGGGEKQQGTEREQREKAVKGKRKWIVDEKVRGMDGREGEQRVIEKDAGESEMRKEIGRRQKIEREETASQ